MPLNFPFIPDGDPLEFRGHVKGYKADLVKNVIRLTIDLEVSPETLAARSKVAFLAEMERPVYVEVQTYRLPADVEAAQRQAAEAATKLHQLTLEQGATLEVKTFGPSDDPPDDEAEP